jgi:hypothetical protein
MRKLALGFVVVLVVCAVLYLRFHHRRGPVETAYVGSRQLTIWSSSAAVKEDVATVNYGDRLEVLARSGDQAQVRTASGASGWVNGDDLLSEEFWQKAENLLASFGRLPVEARGQTRVLSNLHLDPARDSPRVRLLSKGVPLEMFERRPVAVPQPAAAAAAAPTAGDNEAATTASSTTGANTTAAAPAKQEDWWLVRAKPMGDVPVAGWLLGRFVDLNVPSPLPDYATSAGVRIVAWFELNRVPDAKSGSMPQYLVVGAHGPEGQPCDFTMLRVYTWDGPRQRYETAFVESDLCGKLPVQVTPAPKPGGDAGFAFEDWQGGAGQRRGYRMTGTVIRRIREGNAAPKHKHGR